MIHKDNRVVLEIYGAASEAAPDTEDLPQTGDNSPDRGSYRIQLSGERRI